MKFSDDTQIQRKNNCSETFKKRKFYFHTYHVATCKINEKEYKVGQNFIPDDCSGSCTCKGGRNVACNSLCPPSYVSCKPGEQIENYKEAVTGSNCYCQRQRCVKGNLINKYMSNPQDIGHKLNV